MGGVTGGDDIPSVEGYLAKRCEALIDALPPEIVDKTPVLSDVASGRLNEKGFGRRSYEGRLLCFYAGIASMLE